MKKMYNLMMLALVASIYMHKALHTHDNAIMLSTNKGQYLNEEIIELSLIFNRFLKKWTLGIYKMPFKFHGELHSLKTLTALEQDNTHLQITSSVEYDALLMNVKQKFIHKTKRFIDCSRSFAKILYPLIEEDCIKRNHSNSFLRAWIKTDKKESAQLFMQHINSFTDLYTLCTDLIYLIKDLVYSCPKALHNFELKIKKIKKFKELLPHVLEELHLQEDIDKKLLIAEFKFHEVSTLSFDEINKEQVRVVIQTFLQK